MISLDQTTWEVSVIIIFFWSLLEELGQDDGRWAEALCSQVFNRLSICFNKKNNCEIILGKREKV